MIISLMDPLTHALTGATIGKLGFKGRAAFYVAVLASVAPDFDYITRLWGAEVFLRHHRGITHGVAALIAVPLIIGLTFGQKKGFFKYFTLSFLAYGFHLLMDLSNQYGTRVLFPLDRQAYALDLVFIIDPYIIILLIAGIASASVSKKRSALVAGLTLLLLCAYIGGRYHLHERAETFVKKKLDTYVSRVYPLPNAFLRWWVVAKKDGNTHVGSADMFTGRICLDETFSAPPEDPAIEQSKKSRTVKTFLDFARNPYPTVKRKDGSVEVIWRELSYSFLAGEHFAAHVFMDGEGRILKSYFKF